MDIKDIIAKLHSQAKHLGACGLFSGKEGLPEVARLFTSAPGREFCLSSNFPMLEDIRLFKDLHPEQYGIYIDAGEITLHDPKTAVLIGDTTATVHCNKCQNNTIVTMHGATATVLTSGWAVVRIEAGKGTNIAHRVTDNAIVL